MNIEEIREYALNKPNVEECTPFGPDAVVYKVNGKMFLLMRLNAEVLSFNVKCDPEKALLLREQFNFVKPGYHMNKKHWNTVLVNADVPHTLLQEMIDDSYNLVCKKKI